MYLIESKKASTISNVYLISIPESIFNFTLEYVDSTHLLINISTDEIFQLYIVNKENENEKVCIHVNGKQTSQV